jgi:hypothetical protein
MLNEKAMISVLNIRTWSARKYDRAVSKDVTGIYNTKEDSGRWNKLLISGDENKTIQKIARDARSYHKYHTWPWDNAGGGILPTKSFYKYSEMMNQFKEDYEHQVKQFIRQYPVLRENERSRLGRMYKEEDYPDLSEIGNKYSFDVYMYPIPEKDDLRLSLNADDVENIKIKLEKNIYNRINNGMKDLWNRLYMVVQPMVDRLSNEDNKFKNTLVTNITKLCETMPDLNILEDEELNAMTKKIYDKLTKFSPEDLRENTDIRNDTMLEAKRILDNLRGYIK